MTSQIVGAQPAQARYASIVIDADTGDVLRSRNADTRRYPASLTKMMTLYLLFEAIDNGRLSLDSKLKISKRAARQPPSKLGLRAGKTIRVKDAISALIVKSANDIAVVVAETLGKTEKGFAEKMTRKAHALGMSRTTFRNASGLPNRGQRSTARDMARLARALMRDFPHRYHYFDDQRFRYAGKEHRTPNRLLGNYRGLDGMKTGYIRASGFNLVASAERDGRRIIAVVFGGRTSRSRNAHMANLLDLGFTRLAERRPARSRLLVAGIPRPPSASSLAAPSPRFKPPAIQVAAAPASPLRAEAAVVKPPLRAEVAVAAAPPRRQTKARGGPAAPADQGRGGPAAPVREAHGCAHATGRGIRGAGHSRGCDGGQSSLGHPGGLLHVGHGGRDRHATRVRAGADSQWRVGDSRAPRRGPRHRLPGTLPGALQERRQQGVQDPARRPDAVHHHPRPRPGSRPDCQRPFLSGRDAYSFSIPRSPGA